MGDTFLTVSAPSEGIYKEKMSKFLAFAHPAASAADAKAIVASYQKKYHDARHVCWAYMIGADRREFLSNDNGEPSGTAGKPILGQINSFNLTNVVIVVVRYFGGIKLGTGGLIVAYREAAREALSAADIIEAHEMAEIRFTFPYVSMNDVMRAVKDPQVRVLSQNFDNACEMTITTRADNAGALSARLSDIDGVTFSD
ncbi:MAG: IMPACT family protein [Bacteroides sp.]|nr:IMPACT family protein [Bacteroides sp.]MCM1389883.1 IMPACT family protein [Bacteroides sp.]